MATRTWPQRSSSSIVDVPEPAVVDRLVAGPDPREIAEPLLPAASDGGGLIVVDVELAEASLPREGGDSGHQDRVVLGHDLMVGGDVDHAVITGDDQPHVVGQRVPQPLTHRVDPAQLLEPGLGSASVHMPAMVEFALVRVDEAVVTAGGGLDGQLDPQILRGLALESDEIRAAQCGLGETGDLEALQGHRADRHARLDGPLEEGRLGLVGAGDQIGFPGQRVEDLPGRGNPGRVADHAVLAGRQAGAEAGQAGDRGARHARGDRLGVAEQRAEVRRLAHRPAQQVPAEAVDQHDHVAVRLGQPQHVLGAAGHPQVGAQTGHQVDQRGGRVRGHDHGRQGRPLGRPHGHTAAERCSELAKRTSRPTRSGPSAAALIRTVRSSPTRAPVNP